jgi:hypothetical protein
MDVLPGFDGTCRKADDLAVAPHWRARFDSVDGKLMTRRDQPTYGKTTADAHARDKLVPRDDDIVIWMQLHDWLYGCRRIGHCVFRIEYHDVASSLCAARTASPVTASRPTSVLIDAQAPHRPPMK